MRKSNLPRTECRFVVLIVLISALSFFFSLTEKAHARLVIPALTNPAKALEKKPAKKISAPLDAAVTFDQTHYSLTENAQFIVFKSVGGSMQVAKRGCSKPYADQIKNAFRELESHSTLNSHQPVKEDVIVIERKNRASIGRGSEFGQWLRALPRTFPSLVAESRVACAH